MTSESSRASEWIQPARWFAPRLQSARRADVFPNTRKPGEPEQQSETGFVTRQEINAAENFSEVLHALTFVSIRH